MEQVLVVDKCALEALLPSQGLITDRLEDVRHFIQTHFFFTDRARAEYDKTVKQIIPYVVIRQEGRYFMLRRLKQQTEARLHDKRSLGVGGHINPSERAAVDVLKAGLMRELYEEVEVEQIVSLTCVGILNENSGSVSDYHTGVVYLLEAQGEVRVRETEKMTGTWASVQDLRSCYYEFETWSQLVICALLQGGIV